MTIPGDRRSLIHRHKWKVIISVFGITAVCATGSILIYLIKRWLYRQQLRISEDHFMREQMRRRFVQTQEDSLRTVGQLLPVFAIVLNNDDLNIDDLFMDLKNMKNGNEKERNDKKRSKAELWNELKINSIVKVVTITYTISTFILLTRLQLNMLARREYLEAAVTMNVEKKKDTKKQYYITTLINKFWNYNSVEPTIEIDNNESSSAGIRRNKITYINEQAYLSLSWWLLNRGYQTFRSEVYRYVTEEFSTINPRDQLTISEFNDHLSKIFQSITRDILVHKDNGIKMTQIMLPSETELFNVLQETLNPEELQILREDDTVLKKLILEAAQCIESSASNVVLENLVNISYQYIMNNIETKILAKSQKKQTENKDTTVENTSYQMAMYSIVIKDTCQEILPHSPAVGTTNPFLETLDKLEVLNELSSSVYSNFNI
ncbi:peroxin [Maudiozyma exigua]|uniref:Peroxin-3 n=1 Tax=Maudiozyma exigua TaxID=34358 RepID=A0A9P6WCR7_MAUEX|nr:peroxin [Kazachstania exigua]